METFYGILIPFLGTSLGAASVFFMKKSLSDRVQRSLTGFAAGVMVAASVWSLLIPAIEQSAALGKLSFLPAAVGFWAGVLFLLLLDHTIPHLHHSSEQAEGPKSRLHRTTMMMLAVTLHNIPEGICIALPLYQSTKSVTKVMLSCLLVSISEPLGGIIAYLFLRNSINNLTISIILLFVSGLMITLSINNIYKEVA